MKRAFQITIAFGCIVAPAIGQPADPTLVGQWGSVTTLKLPGDPDSRAVQSVHSILLRTGNILCVDLGAITSSAPHVVLLNLSSGQVTLVSEDWPVLGRLQGHVLFCSGHALRHDGAVVFGHGGTDCGAELYYTTIYRPSDTGPGTFDLGPDEDWSVPSAAFPTKRWYPTLTTLGDGSILVTDGKCQDSINNGRPNTPVILHGTLANPTVWTWEPLEDAEYGVAGPYAGWNLTWYPFMFQLSDGTVFMGGSHYFTPLGFGLNSRRLDPSQQSWTELDPQGNAPIKGGSAVMYRKDLIMKAGGGTVGSQGNPCAENEISNAAYQIDMTTPSPAWTQVASMYHRRIHFYLAALPDGTVLAIGGSKGDDPCNVDNAVHEPEAYDPASNTWARYDANTTPRQYHSSVVLLPDGSLFVAGGQIGDEGSGGTRYQGAKMKRAIRMLVVTSI